MTAPDHITVASLSAEIAWDSRSRVAVVRYAPGASLAGPDGPFLVDALTGWIGSDGDPFGVLADAKGLLGTNAEYRAWASRFFRRHRDRAFIALINLGPVIHVAVEMFRVGTGIQSKTLADEAAARSCLRTKGIDSVVIHGVDFSTDIINTSQSLRRIQDRAVMRQARRAGRAGASGV